MRLIGRHLAFPSIQHLDIAAQRQCGNHIVSAIASAPLPERTAKADGKLQHLDAQTASHPKMPEFMDGHQDAQGDD